MKKALTLTIAICITAVLTVAPLTVPSDAWGSPGANLQQGGDLELVAQFGDIPTSRRSFSSTAAPNLPDSSSKLGTLTRIGALESSSIQEIVVQGNYAFAGFSSTLVVIDITDPANMTRVASLRLGGVIVAMEATPDYLYVSSTTDAGIPSSETGLWIVDISNPLEPVKTGFYPKSWSSDIAIQGDYAYFNTESGLEIIDIATPDNPRLVGALNDIGNIYDITTADGYAYLAGEFCNIYPCLTGVMVLDISNPIQPIYAGQYTSTISGYSPQIEVSNSTLYYAGDYGFQALDISSPAAPTLIGSLTYYGSSSDLTLSGDIAYLAIESCPYTCSGGFQIIDVSNPASPILMGSYNSENSLGIKSISAGDGHVFLTHPGEVQSIDATVPSSPILVDTLESPLDYPRRFAVSGEYAYITNMTDSETSSLRIADLSNPSQPVIVGQFPTSGELTDVEIFENIAILTQANYEYPFQGSSAYFIDVSNPQNPVEIGRYNSLDGNFKGVGVQGNYAYLAWESYESLDIAGVAILDITDPINPRETSFYEPPPSESFYDFKDVILQGTYAYLPSDNGLLILDVSDPENPVKVGEYGRGKYAFMNDVALAGDYAYVANLGPGVIILDIRNPAQPVELSTFEIHADNSGIAIQGNHLFVGSQSGLLALDVSTITTPTLAAFYSSFWSEDVSANENDIFLTSSEGFQTLHLTGSISGVVKSPNRSAVPGVTITANDTFTATTNSQGTYLFEGLEPDSYTIVPSLPGFTFTPKQSQMVVPPNEVADFTLLPMSVSAELIPGISTTLTYTDTQGLPTSLFFPAGAVTATTHVVVTPAISNDMAGSAFTGHAFELAAYQGGVIVPGLNFNAPISVTIQYSPTDVALVSDKEALALWWWDGTAWVDAAATCQPPGSPQHDPESGSYQVAICRTGLYSLYGPTKMIFIPVIVN